MLDPALCLSDVHQRVSVGLAVARHAEQCVWVHCGPLCTACVTCEMCQCTCHCCLLLLSS